MGSEMCIRDRLNPTFASLNLAQAVLLVGYEWFQTALSANRRSPSSSREDTRPATQAELRGLFEHLEGELDACGFLRVKEKRPGMIRNIRNIFMRASLSDREVSTLRGIVTGLTHPKG